MEQSNSPSEPQQNPTGPVIQSPAQPIAHPVMEPVAEPALAQAPTPDRFLPVSILIAAVLISGALVYSTHFGKGGSGLPSDGSAVVNTNNNAAAVVNVSDPEPRDVILGDANAPVTLIEYGDYQCPYCAKFFTQAEQQIRDVYVKTGKVKMIFRDFSILGDESDNAARAAECAKDQGKFWAYHDALFTTEHADNQEGNGNLTRDLFIKLATQVKMNTGDFTKCYDANTYAQITTDSRTRGQSAGVSGTPSVFIDGTAVGGGAGTFASFKAIIDAELAKKQ